MVPATSSISLTLENMYTETTLSPLPTDATADAFYINGQLQSEAGACQDEQNHQPLPSRR